SLLSLFSDNLPKITKDNYKEVLEKFGSRSELAGGPFDAAESELSEEEVEELFRENVPALIVENNQLLTKFFLSPEFSVEYESNKSLPIMRVRGNSVLETVGMLKYTFKKKNAVILEDGGKKADHT
ncbi:unnamed protein product, partial [Strongylus vulgaris]